MLGLSTSLTICWLIRCGADKIDIEGYEMKLKGIDWREISREILSWNTLIMFRGLVFNQMKF